MEDLVTGRSDIRRAEFWNARRVVLTGHTGFKGGWLAAWLRSMGADVMGYALPPNTDPSFFESAHVARGVSSVFADIRDVKSLQRAITSFEPEIVFHLAAQPLVRKSYADPVETYSVNVVGTASLLDAVRQTPSVRVVVAVTSDKCYENREWNWGYRETDRLGGRDPYSNSKACQELVTQAFRESFFSGPQRNVAVATARAGNVIGGGDWAVDRLVPDLVRAILEGRPAELRRPDAIRPWQHVLDALSGYLLLAERLATDGRRWSGAWNFGPGDADVRSVQWVAQRIVDTWGEGACWRHLAGEQPHEARMLSLDICKVRRELGWQPRWDIDEAIARTVEWYRAYSRGSDLAELTHRQIVEFEATRE